MEYDIVIAGGGPAGLAAAESSARAGARTLVLEQSWQIGSPTRTSGGSFIDELTALGLPAHLWHPVKRCRFVSPSHDIPFDYDPPVLCIIDVHATWQYLATRAVDAGAEIRVAHTAVAPVLDGKKVRGVRAKDQRGREFDIEARVTIDATGYRATLLRAAGVHPGFARFGVGAEYDLYAPDADPDEAVLIVGSRVAPSGYGWVFPWGDRRLRVGVGVIHKDSDANPREYLDQLVSRLGLGRAQPVEYHEGLIPSDGMADVFYGDGILGAGDSGGHPSALLGEGIRWAIEAGILAGEVAASGRPLVEFEREWRRRHGVNLRIAKQINRRMARWDDAKWDRRAGLLRLLTPAQFAEALKTHFVARWPFDLVRAHPKLLKEGFAEILRVASGNG